MSASELNAPEFLVAEADGQLRGAIGLETRAPGLLSIVPPSMARTSAALREALIDAAMKVAHELAPQAVVLLVEPTDRMAGEAAGGAGMYLAAEIRFLERHVSAGEVSGELAHLRGREVSDDELVRVMQQTLEGSLDCPALRHVMGAREMWVGFSDRAPKGDREWSLVESENQPMGCLLLRRAHEVGELELMYMGVLPAARGRGLGGQLVLRAIQHAFEHQLSRVVLAVDSGNSPAMTIYQRLGFEEFGRRMMWLQTPP